MDKQGLFYQLFSGAFRLPDANGSSACGTEPGRATPLYARGRKERFPGAIARCPAANPRARSSANGCAKAACDGRHIHPGGAASAIAGFAARGNAMRMVKTCFSHGAGRWRYGR